MECTFTTDALGIKVCILTFTVETWTWEEEEEKTILRLLFPALTPQLHLTVMTFYQQRDKGFNLFTLYTTISEDLSNKSAKSTHPRHFPFLSPLSSVIIFSEWKLRKCYAFLTVQRGWLHGHPLAVHLICFRLPCLKPPCEENKRGPLRILFWYCSHFLPCAQQKCTQISGTLGSMGLH